MSSSMQLKSGAKRHYGEIVSFEDTIVLHSGFVHLALWMNTKESIPRCHNNWESFLFFYDFTVSVFFFGYE